MKHVLPLVVLCVGTSCGPSKGVKTDPDGNRCVSAAEVCDGKDNDCDGKVDNGLDKDADGYACAEDCDETSRDINVSASETLNSKDDNCDGKVDNRIPGRDWDNDGATYPLDCDDDNALIGSKAIEVPNDGVDNNCNREIDEPVPACEGLTTSKTAAEFVKAMDLCTNVLGAAFVSDAPLGRSIRQSFGTELKPQQGKTMTLLSSGLAQDALEVANLVHQPGKGVGESVVHPLLNAPYKNCAGTGTITGNVNDATELKLTLEVPQNAKGLSFKFNFLTAEYPEYLCTRYNDRFLAILESKSFKGNISFDKTGEMISVNNAFFDVCQTFDGNNANGNKVSNTCTKPITQLAKTGFDPLIAGIPAGGATGWLTTKAPVTPNETITLRFIIFDESDSAYDSSVLIDDFRWEVEAVDAPSTEPILE